MIPNLDMSLTLLNEVLANPWLYKSWVINPMWGCFTAGEDHEKYGK